MERRRFLQALVRGAALVPFVPTAALAASRRRIVVQQSPLAGFQYHRGGEVFELLAVGSPLRLEREPENRYDKRAVAVYFGNAKLGFVPKMDNTAVAQMLDRNEPLAARIVRLRRSDNPWDRIRFEVVLND